VRRVVYSSGWIRLGAGRTKYIRVPKHLAIQLEEKLGRDPWDEDCLVGLEESPSYLKFYVIFPKNGVQKEDVMSEVRTLCASNRASARCVLG